MSAIVFGQTTKSQSLTLNLLGWHPNTGHQVFYQLATSPHLIPLNVGITYNKDFFNHFRCRFSVNYRHYQNKKTFEATLPMNLSGFDYFYRDFDIKLGVAYFKTFKTSEWYAGFDVSYLYTYYQHRIWQYENTYSDKIQRHGIGISPFLGWRKILNEHWSIGLESSFRYFRAGFKHNYAFTGDGFPITDIMRMGFEDEVFEFSPISAITFSYHF